MPWFIRPGLPTVTGAASPSMPTAAWATITVPVALDDTRAIEITEEASLGTVAPTDKPLLTAKAWR